MTKHQPSISRHRRRWLQRGEGRLSVVIWLAIIIWAFLAGMEFFPTRYRVSELEDAMVRSAERAGQPRGPKAEGIKRGLLYRATELDLPVTEKDIEVVVNSNFVKITASYVMPIRLPLYTYNWQVHHEVRRNVFIF